MLFILGSTNEFSMAAEGTARRSNKLIPKLVRYSEYRSHVHILSYISQEHNNLALIHLNFVIRKQRASINLGM